ncbi:MAG TPA: hypothetical protein VGF22_00280, partial [Acidimicrobiales bacterium]
QMTAMAPTRPATVVTRPFTSGDANGRVEPGYCACVGIRCEFRTNGRHWRISGRYGAARSAAWRFQPSAAITSSDASTGTGV